MTFFKTFLAALALAVPAAALGADEVAQFSNPTAGIALSKPSGWHYTSAAQNMENIKAMKLSDEEMHAMLKQYTTAPLLAMAKYREPFDDVNPSFKINLKPYGNMKGIASQDLLRLLLPQLQKAFKDFSVAQAPTDVLVSGIPSAYIRVNYTMELSDGRSFPAASELWIVPRGDYFFMMGAGTRQDEKTGTRAEIQDILNSIRITQ